MAVLNALSNRSVSPGRDFIRKLWQLCQFAARPLPHRAPPPAALRIRGDPARAGVSILLCRETLFQPHGMLPRARLN